MLILWDCFVHWLEKRNIHISTNTITNDFVCATLSIPLIVLRFVLVDSLSFRLLFFFVLRFVVEFSTIRCLDFSSFSNIHNIDGLHLTDSFIAIIVHRQNTRAQTNCFLFYPFVYHFFLLIHNCFLGFFFLLFIDVISWTRLRRRQKQQHQ